MRKTLQKAVFGGLVGLATILGANKANSANIDIINDNTYENNENFTIELIDPNTSATLANSTYTIENDDAKPKVSLAYNGPSSNEEGASNYFTVNVDGKTSVPITVNFNYSNGVTDPTSGTLTASKDYSFQTADDSDVTTGTRTAYVNLGNVVNADKDTPTSLTFNVEENDTAVRLQGGLASIVEGDTNTFLIEMLGKQQPTTVTLSCTPDFRLDYPSEVVVDGDTYFDVKTSDNTSYEGDKNIMVKLIWTKSGQVLIINPYSKEFELNDNESKPEPAAVDSNIWRLYE